jgi:hypothetical protein
MADLDKLFAAVRDAPANTDFNTLTSLMRSAAFDLRMGKKQHAVFINRTTRQLINVAKPHRGPVKPVYVRECLKVIAAALTEKE